MVSSVIFYSFAVICASIVVHGNINANAEEELHFVEAFMTYMISTGLMTYLETEGVIHPEDTADIQLEISTVLEKSRESIRKKVEAAKSQGKTASSCQDTAESKINEHQIAVENQMYQCFAEFADNTATIFADSTVLAEATKKIARDMIAVQQKCAAVSEIDSDTCNEKEMDKLEPAMEDLKSQAVNAIRAGHHAIGGDYQKCGKCCDQVRGILKSALAELDTDVDTCIAAS